MQLTGKLPQENRLSSAWMLRLGDPDDQEDERLYRELGVELETRP